MSWGNFAAAALQVAGTAYAANQTNKGARDAANAAGQASADSSALNKYIYDDQRALNMPFYQGGLQAFDQYRAMLGLPVQQGGSMQANYGMQQPQQMPTQWFGQGWNKNDQLYASDPLYRQAWDEVAAHHQSQFGKGYTRDSDLGKLASHMQEVYTRLQPQQQTGGTLPAMSQQDAFAQFRNAPGYQFGLKEGQRAVEASAAARGGLNSGATLKALQRYGNDYADQQGFTPYMNRLASLWGGAQTAGGAIGNAGQNYASAVGQNMWNAANARGQSAYDRANTNGWMAGQLANIAGNYFGGRG